MAVTEVGSFLRVAVIGAGAMGRSHCRVIHQAVADMRLAAVVDTHAATAAEVAEPFKVPSFASVEAFLNANVADAAVVATPHPLHLAVVEACLEAGLHVLCEKPLAETVSAADRMLAVAERSGRTLGVMFQRRYEPVFDTVLQFVREGGLGTIRRTLLVLPEYRTQTYYDANPWRATWSGEGGGVLINQAPHLLDLFVLLGGMPSSVQGWTTNRLHKIEVEDQAEARLKYADGGTGFLYASTNEPVSCERIEMAGTRGCLRWTRDQLECIRYGADIEAVALETKDIWWRPEVQDVTPPVSARIAPGDLQGLLMHNFAGHILRGDALRCDARSGRNSLELANAITLSSHLDREVSLPVDRQAYDELLSRLRKPGRTCKPDRPFSRVTDPRLL